MFQGCNVGLRADPEVCWFPESGPVGCWIEHASATLERAGCKRPPCKEHVPAASQQARSLMPLPSLQDAHPAVLHPPHQPLHGGHCVLWVGSLPRTNVLPPFLHSRIPVAPWYWLSCQPSITHASTNRQSLISVISCRPAGHLAELPAAGPVAGGGVGHRAADGRHRLPAAWHRGDRGGCGGGEALLHLQSMPFAKAVAFLKFWSCCG